MGTPLASGSAPPGGSELDRLRARVARYFPVYETHVGPQSVAFAVHVDRSTLEPTFRTLADELWTDGYVPFLRTKTGEDFIEVAPRPTARPSAIWANVGLLAATIASTIFTGALIWLSYVGGSSIQPIDFLYGGLYFALPLLAILGGHELAHYVVARRNRLDASLPYFIPIPPPFLFGTLGAFISIRQPFPDRKALFDIGAAGPIAGFAISIPVTLLGMYLSATGPVVSLGACGVTFLGTNYSNLLIGQSILWYGLSQFFPSQLLSLHPLALAGWVGIFVTAINLLPAGQLDGGHVWRALLGDRTRFLSYGFAIFLVALGLFAYLGWLVFAVLIIFLGLRHPPPLNDVSPIGWKRWVIGLGVAAILVVGFTLIPVAVQSGQLSSNGLGAAPISAPGYATAGHLSVNLTNVDPVAHGLVFLVAVSAVYPNGTGPPLNATALAAWASQSNWVVNLSGERFVLTRSANITAPGNGAFYTLNGTPAAGSTVAVAITFTNSEPSAEVDIVLTASEVCPPPGSGPLSLTFALKA